MSVTDIKFAQSACLFGVIFPSPSQLFLSGYQKMHGIPNVYALHLKAVVLAVWDCF